MRHSRGFSETIGLSLVVFVIGIYSIYDLIDDIKDKYNENSDKPNIAEILIEKHRNGPVGKVELYFDEKKTTFLSIEKSDFGVFEEAEAEES